jgi:hypothetical protein
VKERSALTIGQRRRLLKHITGTPLSDFTLRRLRKRLGFSQKTDYGAVEWAQWLKAAWKPMVAKGLDARRLVFVDEMGTNASLSPVFASLPERTKGVVLGARQPRA